MPGHPDHYDFFVSYARKDNANGWISGFIQRLQDEHRAFTGGREFRIFFDKADIRSLDDWQHRIYESLAASRLLMAFISPHYFASEWCRREWRTWIDVEIARHVLSDGAAPIYIIEVPWLGETMTEQQVAQQIAALTQGVPDAGLARDILAVTTQVSQRQLTAIRPFFDAGLEALRREELREVLTGLAKNLSSRSEHVEASARSSSTIPPYNRRFVGRLDELTLLRQRLHQGRTGVISGHKAEGDRSIVAGVHGLGGIGKTELAFTYAHAFAGLYPGGRFLVPCEGHSDLRQAMLALDEIFREQIGDEQRKGLESHFSAVRDCLRQRLQKLGRILLVLDNVTDRSLLNGEQTDQIRTLGSNLHLLATTRLGAPEEAALDDVHWLTLGELSFEDSLRLLEKFRSFASPVERAAAGRIAHRLGGFALCIEVVGAYLSQHPGQTYATFLETMGLGDLERVDQTAERRDVVTRRHNNEKRLAAILKPALASLSAEDMTALEFAALLPPDQIALPWLRSLTGASHSALANDSELWQRLVNRLMSLALLTRGKDGQDPALDDSHQPRVLRCHRLLQDHLRAGFSAGDRYQKQAALDALLQERQRALQATSDWSAASWELDPVEAMARLLDEHNHSMALELLNSAGFFWKSIAEWARAEPLYRRALAIVEARPDHPAATRVMNNLALLLLETARFAEAEALVRKALASDERVLGPEHPSVATHLHTLASLLQQTNRVREAEAPARRALEIDQRALGPNDPKVAIRLSSLAQILRTTNRLTDAEPLMRRALEIDEHHFGREHAKIAIRLNNLAMLLKDTGRLDEAEPMFRRALAIDERTFGESHPSLASALNNLAQLLLATRRPHEAESMLRRALAIDEKSFGPDHYKVAAQLNTLAHLLWRMGNRAEAIPMMRRAIAIDERAFGPDHPSVATGVNNFAMLIKDMGEFELAEQMMRRALSIRERSFGPDHPDVAVCLHNLALVLKDTDREAEAELLMRRAVAILLKYFRDNGRKHKDADAIIRNYQMLLGVMGFSSAQVRDRLNEVGRPFGFQF